ncbi:TPA: hypothetical protein ACH3X1_015488 [Trebouxia sp. C0004]
MQGNMSPLAHNDVLLTAFSMNFPSMAPPNGVIAPASHSASDTLLASLKDKVKPAVVYGFRSDSGSASNHALLANLRSCAGNRMLPFDALKHGYTQVTPSTTWMSGYNMRLAALAGSRQSCTTRGTICHCPGYSSSNTPMPLAN